MAGRKEKVTNHNLEIYAENMADFYPENNDKEYKKCYLLEILFSASTLDFTCNFS